MKKVFSNQSLPFFSLSFLIGLYAFFLFLAAVESQSAFFQITVKPFIGDKKVFPSFSELVPISFIENPADFSFAFLINKKNPKHTDNNQGFIKDEKNLKHKKIEENESVLYQKDSLNHFIENLRLLKNGQRRHVHILHWGDSIIWGDWLSYRLKERFQDDFGDGGRGILPIKPSPAETLKGINTSSGYFLKYYIPFESFAMKEDKNLGLLGYSYWSSSSNAYMKISSGNADWDSIDILLRNYKSEKSENIFNLRLNEEFEIKKEVNLSEKECKRVRISMAAYQKSEKAAPVRQLKITRSEQNGNHPYWDMLSVQNKTGLIYSSVVQMGLHQAWNLKIPEKNLQCGFSHSGIDLIIFQFGVNESASMHRNYRGFTEEKYYKQLDDWYGKIKKNAAGIPVLVLGPYERLVKRNGIYVPHPSHEKVRKIQKKLSKKHRFAYLSIYDLLGGPGHSSFLVDNKYILKDYIHLTHKGSFYLGDLIYSALHREAFPNIETNQKKSDSSSEKKNTKEKQSSGAIQFNSINYYIFFFIIFYAAYVFIRLPNLRLILLLLASYYFYATWMAWPLILIVISTVIDYFSGRFIAAAKQKKRSGRMYLILSLVSNLGMLAVFKYLGFFSITLNEILSFSGAGYQIPVYHLLLPVGISFYTFQTLSYTIDVYREKIPVEKNFLRFALFVTFFPQLVAGPIVRAGHFLPAIKENILHFTLTQNRFNRGIFIILTGLLKKTFADYIGANLVERVFESPDMYSSWETLLAFYGYGLQIYGDFSGYSDIAIGSAMLLGFHLTINFRRPYSALSVTDFWRRWHISLGSWIRDYLYIPLGGNRGHVYRNLIITMFLAGLWHGAGFQFILWGLYLGFFLILERVTGLARLSEKDGSSLKKVFFRLITLHVILFSWVIFRSSSIEQFIAVLSNLRVEDLLSFSKEHFINLKASVFFAILFFYVYQWSPVKWKVYLREQYSGHYLFARVVFAAAIILFIYHIRIEDIQPFIYFQF